MEDSINDDDSDDCGDGNDNCENYDGCDQLEQNVDGNQAVEVNANCCINNAAGDKSYCRQCCCQPCYCGYSRCCDGHQTCTWNYQCKTSGNNPAQCGEPTYPPANNIDACIISPCENSSRLRCCGHYLHPCIYSRCYVPLFCMRSCNAPHWNCLVNYPCMFGMACGLTVLTNEQAVNIGQPTDPCQAEFEFLDSSRQFSKDGESMECSGGAANKGENKASAGKHDAEKYDSKRGGSKKPFSKNSPGSKRIAPKRNNLKKGAGKRTDGKQKDKGGTGNKRGGRSKNKGAENNSEDQSSSESDDQAERSDFSSSRLPYRQCIVDRIISDKPCACNEFSRKRSSGSPCNCFHCKRERDPSLKRDDCPMPTRVPRPTGLGTWNPQNCGKGIELVLDWKRNSNLNYGLSPSFRKQCTCNRNSKAQSGIK